jgi:hypothetical protein
MHRFIHTVFLMHNKQASLFSGIDEVITALFVLQLLAKLVVYGPVGFWSKVRCHMLMCIRSTFAV